MIRNVVGGDGQQKLDAATAVEDQESAEKALTDHEDALNRHAKTIEDYENNIVQIGAAIDEATELSGMHVTLTDTVNGYRITSALDRFEFEKKAKDVDKTQGAFIGALKQIEKQLKQRLRHANLNPPEAPGTPENGQEGD